jgi:hypothetical protein
MIQELKNIRDKLYSAVNDEDPLGQVLALTDLDKLISNLVAPSTHIVLCVDTRDSISTQHLQILKDELKAITMVQYEPLGIAEPAKKVYKIEAPQMLPELTRTEVLQQPKVDKHQKRHTHKSNWKK